jgi:hypothetical protein
MPMPRVASCCRRFMAFEVNLDADPEDMIDPHTISDEESYRKAQSVAFFETRLFLNGEIDIQI